jgi:hypothetical protein
MPVSTIFNVIPTTLRLKAMYCAMAPIETRLDIHSMLWFIPSIAQSTPLQRLYELMRRYQNFFWAVFRTDAYILASKASEAAKGGLFQELAICATMALLGKFAACR